MVGIKGADEKRVDVPVDGGCVLLRAQGGRLGWCSARYLALAHLAVG